MSFNFPQDLHPVMNPLAWLVGSWRGWGVLSYPEVPEQLIVQEMSFSFDPGQPWVRQKTRLWSCANDSAESVERDLTGQQGADLLHPTALLSVETAYWRPAASPLEPNQNPAGSNVNPQVGGKFELLSTDPSGYLMMWVAEAKGPRIRAVTDAVVRSPDAPEMTAATRMFGLVEGDLMWAQDIAALGHELQSYVSGRLSRQAEN